MAVKLCIRILSYQGEAVEACKPCVFGPEGGTIGRSPEGNRLMLADPAKSCSRWHGEISFRDGSFLYTNISETVGTEWLRTGEWLNPGDRVLLQDGDRIGLGDYELEVSVVSDAEAGRADASAIPAGAAWGHMGLPAEASFWPLDERPDTAPWSTPPLAAASETLAPADLTEPDSWLADRAADLPAAAADELEPAAANGAMDADDLWSAGLPDRSPAQPSAGIAGAPRAAAPAPLPPPAVAKLPAAAPAGIPGAGQLFAEFLSGAGLDGLGGMGEEEFGSVMRTAGELLRTFVEETIRGLKVRSESKAVLDIHRTIVPDSLLKIGDESLLPDVVAQRLKCLLTGHCPGFEDPVRSVRNGFADLAGHQMAVDAGWQAALDAVMAQFAPEEFEKASEEALVFQKKAKCWEAYVKTYPQRVREVRESVVPLEFAAGYENQIARVRSAGPNEKAGRG